MLELEIKSIMKRVPSESGVTEPYICRCNDGRIYFAKGYSAGAVECISELVAAEIGTRFGLPIPQFGVADTTKFFSTLSKIPDYYKGIQGMPAFVSLEVENCIEYIAANNSIPREKQAEFSRILFFDWWIQNPDRTKSHPNLLKQVDTGDVYVIDHNWIFVEDFADGREQFISSHVFGQCEDLYTFRPETYESEMDDIMLAWDEIAGRIPDAWLELCTDADILDSIKNKLNRYKTNPAGFWKNEVKR